MYMYCRINKPTRWHSKQVIITDNEHVKLLYTLRKKIDITYGYGYCYTTV